MGIFKDLRDTSAIGKEMRQGYDPAERVRAASEQMRQAGAQPSTDGVPATAMVVAFHDTGTMVNLAPVMSVDLTVLPVGGPAYPAQTTVHGHAGLTRCAPGQLAQVFVDRTDPLSVSLA